MPDSTTDTRFDNQVAIVTGAGQGLGFAYAQALLARGARVVISDLGTDQTGEGADPQVVVQAAQRLHVGEDRLLSHSAPLDTEDGCAALVALAIDRFGGLDILIHNAGWVGYEPIDTQGTEFLDRALGINVHAPLWLAKHAWPHLKRSSAPRVVLTTSDRAMYQIHAQPGLTAYAAGKMAQLGIMNALSAEGAEHGILVNAISPVAKTRMWGLTGTPEDLTPESVVPGVLYLASATCRDTGVILRASNGQFTATCFRENPGVTYPRDLARVACASVDEVERDWTRILETGHA